MRVKGGYTTRRRRKAVLNKAEGFWGNRHISFRNAHQSLIKAAQYAYRDRRNNRRNLRRLWISRINASVRGLGYSYSKFINELKQQNIELNRKMLSEWAVNDFAAFENFVKNVMEKKSV
ncbi:large subunit ribosomal protein L20 [Mycoplasmoides fastidiosum]|uniref:Large ribosomal subunit protein bL20 n=1 Tax=Mycoplasmoides fastidiosum TaxID=92758 RepID=A0ABU0LZW7_9BACT|nr:50S ribosomal protein L20 [Mycoplasmoides fastidiosum]MDQ0514138.1 large subunit ribosomal protein L20 [Mycoplasmoides fastidiosum]UUD37454.1 50S ribosomal protein L20 [Mycoplasmoides fastidiosum]